MYFRIDVAVLAEYDAIRLTRGIAQPGSAPALGAGCREFESLYPDQYSNCAPVAHLDRAPAF